jgi:hypothetical protein
MRPPPETPPDTTPQQALSRAAQLGQKNREATKLGEHGVGRVITAHLDPRNWFRTEDDIQNRIAGVVPEKQEKEWQEGLKRTFKRLRDSAGNIDALSAAMDANSKDVTEMIAKINSSGLSDEQKQQAVADVLKIANQVDLTGQDLLLKAKGLGDIGNLTEDQLTNMGTFLSALAGFNNSVRTKYGGLLAMAVEEQGYTGQAMERNVTTLAQGRLDLAPKAQVRNRGEFEKQPKTPDRIALTPVEKGDVQRKILEDALTSDQARLEQLRAEGKTSTDEYKNKLTAAIGLMGTLSQVIADTLNQQLQAAESAAQHALFAGDFAGASSAAEQKIAALKAALKKGDITQPEYQLQADQIQDQIAQFRADGASKQFDDAKISTRNQASLAQAELNSANAALAALQKNHASYEKIKAARERQYAAQNAVTDLNNSEQIAGMQTNLAGIAPGDVIARAQAQLSIAYQQQANAAKISTTSVEYQQATQAVIAAQQAITEAMGQISEADAALAVAIAQAHGDTLLAAQRQLYAAQVKLQDAQRRSGGARTADVINAEAGIVSAQQGINDAIAGIADANSNLAIAMAEAAGKTVDVARLQLAAARRKLGEAQRKSGGTRTVEVINAEAQVKTAEAAARDAALQDKLGTIDFNLQMGTITSNAAIAALQQILKATNLTQQQRREIMLKIKGLQDDLKSALTGSGFNIPDAIKLPTAYEVRRSLGMDKLVKSVQASLTPLAQLSPGSSSSSSSHTVINIQMNNQINANTTQAAAQLANTVVSLINQQTGQQARASSSTPRLVTTR